MTEPQHVPEGMTLVRTTAEWDESSVPDGLLRTHRIAAGVWGLLQVRAGSLRLTFEDDGAAHTVHADEQVVIPPDRPHHVTLDGPVRFVIGFHRPTTATDAPTAPDVSEGHRVGLDALAVTTALHRRVRLADPTFGVFEAADRQWWWRSPRWTDEVPQLCWFDDQGEPVAAAVLTAWEDTTGLDVVRLPDARADFVDEVVGRAVAHAAEVGATGLEAPAVATDEVLRAALSKHGLVEQSEEDVDGWLAVDDRPTPAPLPGGYRLARRSDRLDTPHHFTSRGGPATEERLRQTSLYRADLDLVVLDPTGTPAAYGLCWFDPVTATGLVEPMRTEDEHQGRGLARHVLTTGVDLLARAGATRVKIAWDPANTPAARLYTSVGFGPPRVCLTARRPSAT